VERVDHFEKVKLPEIHVRRAEAPPSMLSQDSREMGIGLSKAGADSPAVSRDSASASSLEAILPRGSFPSFAEI